MAEEGSTLPARASGVLLHPSSLPGPGIGTIGASAHGFVDWLADAGQSYWQILPLVPVDGGGSPYNGLSALAGNPLLVDLAPLADEGLIRAEEIAGGGPPAEGRIDFETLIPWKEGLLRRAYGSLRGGAAPQIRRELEEYRVRQAWWLDDYALFRAIRQEHGGRSWAEWEPGLRGREVGALAYARRTLAAEIGFREFAQFLFDRQWAALRRHAADRGVRIIGDVPIFVAYDSADVWANPRLFELDADGRPTAVSGVPPDYFSETGQLWGNPLFRWDRIRADGYRWWIDRFRRTFEWVDLVRIDHFRGFESYWAVPGGETTALHGAWRPGPGAELFRVLQAEIGALPVIAEDLGLITPAVDALREELGLPGMRVLQFAFDGDPANPHLPENHPPNSVAYVGTHDNDTAVGWWSTASEAERERAERVLALEPGGVHWRLTALALGSRARLAVLPVQDLLGKGSEARMNTPGTIASNWTWRLGPADLDASVQQRLLDLTRRTGRLAGRSGSAGTLNDAGRT
jgi:4-alpha-glucanotransferase